MLRYLVRTLALGFFFFFTASISSGADNGIAEALFRRGLLRFNEGKYVAARLDFSEIVRNHKKSPRITTSHMILSKIYYSLGEFDEAATVASELQRSFPRSRYKDWARYMIGACRFRSGRSAEALEILANLAERTRDKKLKTNSLRALRYSIQPEVDSASFRTVLKKHGIALSDLEGLKPYGEDDLGSEIPIDTVIRPESMKEAESETETVYRESVFEIKIGLLVPLSGANSLQGNQLLMGVEEALKEKNEVNGKKIRLVVEDTESDQICAGLKTKKLAGEGVIAIIGPVYGESTVTSAFVANALHIPFLASTAQNSSLTDIGKYIFQLNFNPVVQAKALAEFAVDFLGFSNTAIIASKDQWGEVVAEKFGSEVRSLGAEIIKTAFVEPNVAMHDINPIIMSIRENAPLSDAVPESTIVINNGNAFPDTIVIKLDPETFGPQRLVPIDTIDGILISALCPDAVLIAEHILEYNIETILLGDSGWGGDNIAEIGGSVVDGAYIISPSYDYSDSTGSVSGSEIRDIISMKGYDACSLLVHCLEKGARDPDSLVKSLESVKNFQGISSRIEIDTESHTNTAVDFVQIRNGTYIKIPHKFSASE